MKKLTTLLCIALCSILTAKAQPAGEFLDLFTEDVQPKAISENGKWACGAAYIDQSVNAVKWNLTTGETIQLQDSDTEPSDAYCISNDGSLVGGSYLNQPAFNLNGEWITLKDPFLT